MPSATTQPASTADLEAEIQSILVRVSLLENDKSLQPRTRKVLTDRYQQAVEQLRHAVDMTLQAGGYRRVAISAPRLLKALQAELACPTPRPDAVAAEGLTSTQLSARWDLAKADLTTRQKQIEELDTEMKDRETRRVAIPPQIADLTQRLQDVRRELTSLPSDSQSVYIPPRQSLLSAQVRALSAEINALQRELASYEATDELLAARRDLAVRQVANAEREEALWAAQVRAQDAREAEDFSRRMQAQFKELAAAYPAVRELAEHNAELAARRIGPDGLLASLADAGHELAGLQKKLTRLQEDFERVRADITAGGLHDAMGQMLLAQ
ncbi:MAG: hypothetical protein BIFFINMI_01058 [Phycisphaerae bacterium]|nr:hypothetical protein [Phycisphaerae bacterium]